MDGRQVDLWLEKFVEPHQDCRISTQTVTVSVGNATRRPCLNNLTAFSMAASSAKIGFMLQFLN